MCMNNRINYLEIISLRQSFGSGADVQRVPANCIVIVAREDKPFVEDSKDKNTERYTYLYI